MASECWWRFSPRTYSFLKQVGLQLLTGGDFNDNDKHQHSLVTHARSTSLQLLTRLFMEQTNPRQCSFFHDVSNSQSVSEHIFCWNYHRQYFNAILCITVKYRYNDIKTYTSLRVNFNAIFVHNNEILVQCFKDTY